MSKEQNIDDILRLLRDSVSVEQGSAMSTPTPEINHSNNDISEEILKEQLKNQYLNTDNIISPDENSQHGEYIIDSDFLHEVTKKSGDADISHEYPHDDKSTEAEKMEEITSEMLVLTEEQNISDEMPVIELQEDRSVQNDLDDQGNELPELDVHEDNTYKTLEGLVGVGDIETTDEGLNVIDGLHGLEESEKPISDIEDEIVFADDEVSVDDIIEDEISEGDVSSLTKIENDEPSETFLASMRRIGVDFAMEDSEEYQEVTQTKESAELTEEVQEAQIIDDEELDLSTINLMMQFCEKEELEEKIGDCKVEDFLKQEQASQTENVTSPAFEGKEYIDPEQNDSIMESYKKNNRISLLSMCGCILIALIALIFDMMPIFGVRLSGGLDYSVYPVVYVLVGLQFVAFSAAVCYKQLWKGMKRAFSLHPSRHSIVAIILMITALYDIILVIILAFSYDKMPAMFNAAATITVALSSVADYARIASEMRAFSVYSSDSNKYTLVCEKGKGSIAEKMYMGGLENDKRIYSVKCVDFPSGFFRCTEEKEDKNKLLTAATIPTVFVGIILSVIAILLGADAYAALAVFMICIYAVLPISIIFSDFVPYLIASKKLSKRGSAFVGRSTVDKYADCDVMVFGDLHMFRKCKTEEVGIVIYDTGVSYLMLGCLKALYSKIGGPLSGMQMDLPNVFNFDRVDIRRMSRNGIEAVVDKKHVLIVGEHEFLRRYGLIFPDNEKDTERSTLCVSLNGKITAKLSVRYEPEPVFEMLVERLYSEGISCAVQTYDPLINSAMVSSVRTLGDAPISVVHQNTEDFYGKDSKYRSGPDGIISCASRLKLAEVEVWLKRLIKIKKISQRIAIAFSSVGIALVACIIAAGVAGFVNELHVLLFLLLELGMISGIMLSRLPSKKYFTAEALYFELEQKHERLVRKEERAEQKESSKEEKKKNKIEESNLNEQAD